MSETIQEARARLLIEREKGVGGTCPCCDQRVKLYGWTLLSSMVVALAYLVKVSGVDRRPVHMNSDSVPTYVKGARSFPKLVHWGLIEPGERGFWRPTELADQFLRGEVQVPRRVFIYNNTRVGVSDNLCDVNDAIGERFDYEEMVSLPARVR